MRKLLIVLALLSGPTVVLAKTPLTPETIRMEIGRSGAKATVNRLFASGAYDIVISRIKTGNAAWVRLARPLSPGTDAASAEELQQALIYALPKAPRAVLSVVDITGSSVPRSPGDVCSASFFEGDPTDIPAYRAAAIKAVKAVHDPSLQRARAACLKVLTKR